MKTFMWATIITALALMVVFVIAEHHRNKPDEAEVAAAGSPESVVMLKRTMREKRVATIRRGCPVQVVKIDPRVDPLLGKQGGFGVKDKFTASRDDEDALRALAVADLLDVQGPVLFQGQGSSRSAYFQLHLRRGHDRDEYPVFGADADDLAALLRGMLSRLE